MGCYGESQMCSSTFVILRLSEELMINSVFSSSLFSHWSIVNFPTIIKTFIISNNPPFQFLNFWISRNLCSSFSWIFLEIKEVLDYFFKNSDKKTLWFWPFLKIFKIKQHPFQFSQHFKKKTWQFSQKTKDWQRSGSSIEGYVTSS